MAEQDGEKHGRFIVSACLAGVKCRYDGKASPIPCVVDGVRQGKAIPVCPEVLGGLSVPRVPAEQRNGKVITADGRDFTIQFTRGAQIALHIAMDAGCRQAILKAKSPSCGCGIIYDGTFSHKLTAGDGIFCALLKKHRIQVFREDELRSGRLEDLC